MSCPSGSDWQTALDAFTTAVDGRSFVDAFTCLFASTTPGGLLVVGTIIWFGVAAMSFVRTGSFALPVVFTLLFGGAIFAQVVTPVLGMASVLLLGSFALAVVLVARRMDTA